MERNDIERRITTWILIALVLLALSTYACGQSRVDTALNFGVTSADMAQTCYHLNEGWHERFTPSQNCATIAALNYGRATGAFFVDRYLAHHHMQRWAHFQLISAGISGGGIVFSYRKDF